MTLLRAGSEKVCVAPEVQQTLRGILVPKAADVAGDGSGEDKLKAINTLSLTYDLTTLQSFDKAVSRAICNTTVRIAGAGGVSNKFDLTFQLSPSADNPASFVTTTEAPDAKAYVRDLLDTALIGIAADRDKQQQDAADKEAKARLLAVVTPKWLVGAWIAPGADASACRDDNALVFRNNHMFAKQAMSGRWALTGDQLHFVGQGPNGAINTSSTITQADGISFTVLQDDGSNNSWRRCSREELATAPADMTIDELSQAVRNAP